VRASGPYWSKKSVRALSVLPNVRRLADLAPGLEVYLLTVLDQRSVHGQLDHPPSVWSTALPPVGTRPSVQDPLPRVVESHGAALGRVHVETNEALNAISGRELAGVTTSVDVVFSSNPAQVITERAIELDVDLIIMATHGRSGISHLLVGSVTEAVVRNSGKPVLVTCAKERPSATA
jgi:nucleotide-binding universal stress UspA family protein